MPTSRSHLSNSPSLLHLLRRASQAADVVFTEEIAERGITPRQYVVLETVAANHDCSQTDVVKITGIDRSTVADLVRRLVNKGLLTRKRSKDDTRVYAVRLSASGTALLEQCEGAVRRAELRLVEAMRPAKRGDLVNMLNKISAVAGPAETEVA